MTYVTGYITSKTITKAVSPTLLYSYNGEELRMLNYECWIVNENDDKTRLISLPEAAELYGFNAAYLSQLASKGRLQAQKIGNSWVTTPQNVEDYIRSRQKRGAYRDDIQPPDWHLT